MLAFPARRALAHLGVIDRPNERSSHQVPTIRGGGVAMMGVLLSGGAWIMSATASGRVMAPILASSLLLAVVSFLDDLRSVPASVRFGCHAVGAFAALTSLALGGGVGAEGWGWLGLGFAFLWVTGHTNAFNFMDGINGLAGGQAFVTSLGMLLVASAGGVPFDHWTMRFTALLAGVAAGFLPHNFPRARMFMGDVASAPLGYLLAVLVLAQAEASDGRLLVPLLLLHANFVCDTAVTFGRRVARGEAWYKPHREHFYQRLIRAGRSHAQVTGTEMGLQVVVVVLALAWVYLPAGLRPVVPLLVALIWGGFFLHAERVLRLASTDLAQG